MVTSVQPHPKAHQPRGAALLIVVLVVTVISAIGVFAAHSAGRVSRAAGHNRQNLQTRFVAQFGVMAALAEITKNIEVFHGQMQNPQSTCAAVGYNATQTCLAFTQANLQERMTQTAYAGTPAVSIPALVGDLSEPLATAQPLQGIFHVEFTEGFAATIPVPGSSMNNTQGQEFGYYQPVVTARAMVRPQLVAGATECGTNSDDDAIVRRVASVVALRSHVTYGPVAK